MPPACPGDCYGSCYRNGALPHLFPLFRGGEAAAEKGEGGKRPRVVAANVRLPRASRGHQI